MAAGAAATGISLDKASEMASELRAPFVVSGGGLRRHPARPQRRRHRSVDPVAHRGRWGSSRTTPGRRRDQGGIRRGSGAPAQLPGIRVGISQPIIDGVNDMIGGAHSPLVMRIYGEDFSEFAASAARSSTCSTASTAPPGLAVPGAADPADRDQARSRDGGALRHQHGRHQNVIQTGVGGAPVPQVYVGERNYT